MALLNNLIHLLNEARINTVLANKHESIIIQVRIRCVVESIVKVCIFIMVDSASSEAFLRIQKVER